MWTKLQFHQPQFTALTYGVLREQDINLNHLGIIISSKVMVMHFSQPLSWPPRIKIWKRLIKSLKYLIHNNKISHAMNKLVAHFFSFPPCHNRSLHCIWFLVNGHVYWVSRLKIQQPWFCKSDNLHSRSETSNRQQQPMSVCRTCINIHVHCRISELHSHDLFLWIIKENPCCLPLPTHERVLYCRSNQLTICQMLINNFSPTPQCTGNIVVLIVSLNHNKTSIIYRDLFSHTLALMILYCAADWLTVARAYNMKLAMKTLVPGALSRRLSVHATPLMTIWFRPNYSQVLLAVAV